MRGKVKQLHKKKKSINRLYYWYWMRIYIIIVHILWQQSTLQHPLSCLDSLPIEISCIDRQIGLNRLNCSYCTGIYTYLYIYYAFLHDSHPMHLKIYYLSCLNCCCWIGIYYTIYYIHIYTYIYTIYYILYIYYSMCTCIYYIVTYQSETRLNH